MQSIIFQISESCLCWHIIFIHIQTSCTKTVNRNVSRTFQREFEPQSITDIDTHLPFWNYVGLQNQLWWKQSQFSKMTHGQAYQWCLFMMVTYMLSLAGSSRAIMGQGYPFSSCFEISISTFAGHVDKDAGLDKLLVRFSKNILRNKQTPTHALMCPNIHAQSMHLFKQVQRMCLKPYTWFL